MIITITTKKFHKKILTFLNEKGYLSPSVSSNSITITTLNSVHDVYSNLHELHQYLENLPKIDNEYFSANF